MLSRTLDERSFVEALALRQRGAAWDGEEEVREATEEDADKNAKLMLSCCDKAMIKSMKNLKSGSTRFNLTPEEMLAIPSKHTVEGCHKKCENMERVFLEGLAMGFFGPVLHQLTGECPPMKSENEASKLFFEGRAVATVH